MARIELRLSIFAVLREMQSKVAAENVVRCDLMWSVIGSCYQRMQAFVLP